MASSSSSLQPYEDSFASEPPSKRIKSATSLYDVFINHRGSDRKESLVRELYNSLKELKIRGFLDSAVLELVETIPSTIVNVIQSALVHIVIFSKHYAESAWCLDELLLMVQTHATIIPVFYDVKPSELRKQKGTYRDALTTYEKKGKHLDKLDKWREALQAVSNIDGYCKSHLDDSSLCKKIVSAVLRQLKKSFPSAKYLVGLDELVEDFEISCDLMRKENESAKVVAICGMSGIGKTVLAKEIFNRKQREYEASSFLYDVRKKSGRGQLPSLQMKLVKDLLHETPPQIFDVTQGKNILESRIRCHSSSFLMVLDDIDHAEQLDALVISNKLNQPGKNLVIITTSDEQILTWAGITDRYHLKKMDRKFGRKLFCCHAFHEPHASTGYEDLVEAFVDVCEGLPLSLQVLGKNVYGKTRDNWQLELEKASNTLPQELKQKLRINFDSLNDDEKQIFMDIACFFVDKPKSLALRVWDGSGWSGLHALQNLKNKGLVEEVEQLSWNGPQWHDDRVSLRMHRHLRVMGREIADGIDFPRRLWRHQDLKSLVCSFLLHVFASYGVTPEFNFLYNRNLSCFSLLPSTQEFKGGFRKILKNTTDRCFHSFFDISLGSQITYFLGNSNDNEGISNSLLWLELDLHWNVHTKIPSWIPLHNLQCLRIRNGHLKRLWENDLQAPSLLKELQLSGTFMEECPKLSGISKLEKLVLNAEEMPIDGWPLLESLCVHLTGLVLSEDTLSGQLASNNTRKSKSFVLSNFKLKGLLALVTGVPGRSSLEKVEISKQNLVSVVLISGSHYKSIKSLKLYHMENLFEVDLSCLTKLKVLKLKNCSKLKSVSGISDLAKLEVLAIRQCPQLNGLPSLSSLDRLERVVIDRCKKLNFLELKGCKNLKRLSGMTNLPKLLTLNILDSPELEELPTLAFLSCLETIKIDGCEKLDCLGLYCCESLKSVSGMSKIVKLKELTIYDCNKLEELPNLAHQSFLKKITISECRTLQSIALPTKLVMLSISECHELKELSLSGLSCLETVTINRCEKLQDITGIEELQRLKHMQLSIGTNVAVRNCIHRLQRLPSESITASRKAGHGGDSPLDGHLFSDLKDTSAVSKIHMEKDGSGFVEASMDLLETMPESGSLSAIILCVVVLVEECCEDSVYIGLCGHGAMESWIFEEVQIDRGEWIITMVITDQELIAGYIKDSKLGTVEITLDEPRGIKKGWILTVNKGEEWRILRVLNTIVDLYDK